MLPSIQSCRYRLVYNRLNSVPKSKTIVSTYTWSSEVSGTPSQPQLKNINEKLQK